MPTKKKKTKKKNRVKTVVIQQPAPVLAARPVAARKRSQKKSGNGNFGAQLGALVGGGLQKVFKMITGFGDYQVSNNSLMSGGMSPPQIVNSVNKGGIIMRHREYITDITASTNFVSLPFDLNPGLVSTFPWLASVASNFEEYVFRGLIFEFKTMSSDVILSSNTTTALGSVIMATQYNTLDSLFVDKRTMENYEFACSSKPSLSFIHPIECKRSLDFDTHLYVRNGAFQGDQRLYDLGTFQVAVQGMQASSGVIGELWASYEVELFKPKVGVQPLQADHYQLTGVTNILPFGTNFISTNGSTLGTVLTSSTISWPIGDTALYFLYYSITGTAASITAPGIIYIQNTTAHTFTFGANNTTTPPTPASDGFQCPANSVSSARFTWAYGVHTGVSQGNTKAIGSSPIVAIGVAGTLPSSPTSADLYILRAPGQYDVNFNSPITNNIF